MVEQQTFLHLGPTNPGLRIRSLNFGANRSFFAKKVSYLSNLLPIAHFFWATWENLSRSLIGPERFAHFAQKESVAFFKKI